MHALDSILDQLNHRLSSLYPLPESLSSSLMNAFAVDASSSAKITIMNANTHSSRHLSLSQFTKEASDLSVASISDSDELPPLNATFENTEQDSERVTQLHTPPAPNRHAKVFFLKSIGHISTLVFHAVSVVTGKIWIWKKTTITNTCQLSCTEEH